jgi:hypothetical protein
VRIAQVSIKPIDLGRIENHDMTLAEKGTNIGDSAPGFWGKLWL